MSRPWKPSPFLQGYILGTLVQLVVSLIAISQAFSGRH